MEMIWNNVQNSNGVSFPSNYEAIHIVMDLSHFMCPRGGMLRSSKSGFLCARPTSTTEL